MLEHLRARHPWPGKPPQVERDLGPAWFANDDTAGHTAVLKRLIGPETRVVLELGSFCGRSTLGFLRICPNAHVIAVDTWEGSQEHRVAPSFRAILPRLYETFLANLWEHRDRLTAVRATTLHGMEELYALGVPVDAVYLDADHGTAAVLEDLQTIRRYFPDAQVIGDDWGWPSVRMAVVEFARRCGQRVCVQGNIWWFRRQSPSPRVGAARSSAGAIANKVIAMMLYRRPGYTRQVLEALGQCEGIDNYLTVIHVEPGFPEVLHLAHEAPLTRKIIVENPTVLGCTANTYAALDHAFRLADFVISIDDDVLCARDCLRYFEWARKQYRNDPTVFSVAAYARRTPPPARYYAAHRVAWFTPWGWATWANRWSEMRAGWGLGQTDSWDIVVNRMRRDRVQIEPYLARTQNIGAEAGTYVPSAEWHKEHQFNAFGAWSVALYPSARFFEESECATDEAVPSVGYFVPSLVHARHKTPRLHYCTFAGADNRYPYLKRSYETCIDYFDVMHLTDVGASDKTSTLNADCLGDPRVRYRRLAPEITSDWNRILLSAVDEVPEGEWFLFMDSDERPSPRLLESLRELVDGFAREGANYVHLTGLLHLNGELEAGAWRTPEDWFAAQPKTLEEYRRRPVWTKSVLIRRTPGLAARTTGPHGAYWLPDMKTAYVPLWYNHYKTDSQMAQSHAILSWPITSLCTYGVPPESPEFRRHEEIVTRSRLTTIASLQRAIAANTVPDLVMDYWATLRDSPFEVLRYGYRYAHEFRFQVDLRERCRRSCCAYKIRGAAGLTLPRPCGRSS